VLADCELALDKFRDDAIYLSHRLNWVTAIVLLRTVGNVLKTIDAKQDKFLDQAISEAWDELKRKKPDSNIFWEFICEGRNNVVKEYRLGIQTTIFLQGRFLRPGEPEEEPVADSASYQYLVKFGPYKDRLQKEVIQEAIDWWENYLDKIDARVNELQYGAA
jgi:hypothetical protein